MEERVFEIVGAIDHPTAKDNERRFYFNVLIKFNVKPIGLFTKEK